MGRIQRVDETRGAEEEEIFPAQITITLGDGTVTTFRPVVLEDVRSLAKAGITNEVEAAGRLIARNCIKWGDKPGITLPQLRSRDLEDVELISQSLAPNQIPDFTELPDRTKAIALNNGTELIFRRPNYGDAEAISRKKDGDLEAQVAIALRLCIRWGDKDGVNEATLNQLSIGDWQGVAQLVKSFRSKPKDD